MLSQLRSGALELFAQTGVLMSTLVPVASINGVGFAYPTYDKVWESLDGPLGNQIRKAFSSVNLVCLEKSWNHGFRQVTSSTKPILTPDDLSGFKIRVPPSPLWTSMFKAFGAAPVSIPWAETYSAMLGIDALTAIASLAPGAPLCRAYAARLDRDGLEIALKGGQVGAPNFFVAAKQGGI